MQSSPALTQSEPSEFHTHTIQKETLSLQGVPTSLPKVVLCPIADWFLPSFYFIFGTIPKGGFKAFLFFKKCSANLNKKSGVWIFFSISLLKVGRQGWALVVLEWVFYKSRWVLHVTFFSWTEEIAQRSSELDCTGWHTTLTQWLVCCPLHQFQNHSLLLPDPHSKCDFTDFCQPMNSPKQASISVNAKWGTVQVMLWKQIINTR